MIMAVFLAFLTFLMHWARNAGPTRYQEILIEKKVDSTPRTAIGPSV